MENPEQEKASLRLSCRAASEKLTQPHYMDNELCSTQVTYSGKSAAHLSHVDLTGTLLCDSAHVCVSPTRLQMSYDKSTHLNFFLGKWGLYELTEFEVELAYSKGHVYCQTQLFIGFWCIGSPMGAA